MKVYVQTDIEGVAGVTFFESSEPSVENVQHRYRMYRLLTGEVNAAVRGAWAAGATEVVVNDSHNSGYNILFEELDPRCEIIHGRNCSGPHWLPEFDSSFGALVLIGMHAMAGTRNAVLPHSRWEVNGGELFLSEASMAAALAGHRRVPTVFVSGDNQVTAELREKIPRIRCAVVKKALGAYQARSLIPVRACELIAEGVKDGLAHVKEIPPFRLPGPLKLNLIDSPTHGPPFMRMMEESLEAANIEEGMMEFVRRMPWCKFNVELPDGFKFP